MSVAVEPTVRTFTTWTPSLIRSAEIAADAGNLRPAASLCEWLLADDRIRGTLDTRIQALLGLDPSFEASGDKRRSNRAVKALEAGEDWFAGYPESELAQMLTWGILLGAAPMRHRWAELEGHGGRALPMPEFWHPQHIRYDWQARRWMTRVENGLEEEINPGDGAWILHTPYGRNRPWTWGLWRGLSRWVLLKYYAVSDWARHSEQGSVLVATCDKEYQVSDDQRRALATELYNRGREAVAVMPPGCDLKLLEARADTEKIYNAQVKAANMAITIAIRGGNLTTEVSEGGSLAATEAQERTGDWAKLRDDSQKLTTTLHYQSLVWWAEFNFGDRQLAPWPVYPVEPKRDLVARANTATAAVTAAEKFQQLGFEVNPQGFIDEFELSAWLKAPTSGKLEPAKPEPPPAVNPAQPSEDDGNG